MYAYQCVPSFRHLYHLVFLVCVSSFPHFIVISPAFALLSSFLSFIISSVCVPSIRHFLCVISSFISLAIQRMPSSFYHSSFRVCLCVPPIRHFYHSSFRVCIISSCFIRHFECLRMFSFRHFYHSSFPLGVCLLFFILSLVISSVLQVFPVIFIIGHCECAFLSPFYHECVCVCDLFSSFLSLVILSVCVCLLSSSFYHSSFSVCAFLSSFLLFAISSVCAASSSHFYPW